MKINNNKSGFTLLEIIIVIIIVGVLASLALPRFFQTVEFSRSNEALNMLGSVKRAADRCAMMGGIAEDYSQCQNFPDLAMENPGLSSGSHFCYDINWVLGPDELYTITAQRNGTFSGDGIPCAAGGAIDAAGGGSEIEVEINITQNTVSKSGTLNYSGIR